MPVNAGVEIEIRRHPATARRVSLRLAQFFITDAAAPHLDNGYTIFGECAPVDVVHAIASVPVLGERPASPVHIKKVTVAREKPAAAPAK